VADNLWAYTCLVPAGSNPAVTDMFVGNDPVTAIRWRVPPGPRGHLSWYLAQSGAQVLPNPLSTAVVADGEWGTWVLDNLPPNPTWQLFGFNTGADDHSVYLQFYTDSQAVTTSGGGAGGDISDGFPVVVADFATMWGAPSGGTITV
jgi:hypothetical protein